MQRPIRPSQCAFSRGDGFDLAFGALATVCRHPVWMLRTAIFPFVAYWGIGTLLARVGHGTMGLGLWGTGALWALKAALCIPCVAAWCRIGFTGGDDSPAVIEPAGFRRGIDAVAVLAAVTLALGFVLAAAVGPESPFQDSENPRLARQALRLAGGVVLVVALPLGGVRAALSAAGAAVGHPLTYAEAWHLTRSRTAWLATIGLTFGLVYVLEAGAMEGLYGLLDDVSGSVRGLRVGMGFGLILAMAAMSGHALGRVLRRLLEGMPGRFEAESA